MPDLHSLERTEPPGNAPATAKNYKISACQLLHEMLLMLLVF